MVCAEAGEGKLAAISLELLGCGRRLADALGENLSAVLVGDSVRALADEAVAGGADTVYVLEDGQLKDYQADAYLAAMESAVKEAPPRVLLFGQTSKGRDLAPRLAFRLETVAVTDCIELDIEPGSKRLLQTKPVFGGNARAVFTGDTCPRIATVRARAMEPAVPDTSHKGETIDIKVELPASRTRVIEKVVEEVEGVRLETAGVVVAGGRGIGSAEGFKQLEELARLLKGAVGATRPACDNGWAPDVLQIGLTGKIVSPDLYIAVAISGSSQHLAGCSGCKNIVAINKDAEANIFREARYGVVGDWKKVLPAFVEKVREQLA
jgi:electron transfer flavoprotein alpha subunit